MHRPVLWLNADGLPAVMPISIVSARDAVNRIFAGAFSDDAQAGVRVYSSYMDQPIPNRGENELHTLLDLNYWPSICIRKYYLRQLESSPLNARNLHVRDEGKCAYCGEYVSKSRVTIDHYVPKDLGGKNEWDNVVLACSRCNNEKANHEPRGKWKLSWKPHAPDYWELVKKKSARPLKIPDRRWLDHLPHWTGEVTVVDPWVGGQVTAGDDDDADPSRNSS